ncbi:MAG: hypothetical protein J7L44_02325 [Candidatus Diapherotrites archaeon]|nr:hypothetical protein [Candidatus Diapherotrites archaeon]
MLRELVVSTVLLMLIFLSACLDFENTEQAENYARMCLDLTTIDASHIPKCNSVKECFALVEKNLFKFPDEHLSLQAKNILNNYKNSLAKAWFHYNRAADYIEEIRKACRKRNFGVALDKADDLRYEIKLAFKELDNSLSASFAFILWEKHNLETQDINLVREEPLYASYVKLADNTRQIFSEKYLGLDNYASHYWRITENIRAMRIFADSELSLTEKRVPMSSCGSFCFLRIPFPMLLTGLFMYLHCGL